jgi:hypothetical protein
MPRTVHDAFAKEWLKELLADFGAVETERPVAHEVRTIDLVFYPNADSLANLKHLGLLGRMLSRPCPMEFFRNAVPEHEIANCRDKLIALRSQLKRQAKQKGQKSPNRDLPFLWILSPTLSQEMQKTFCMVTSPKWGKGIYFLPKNDFTAVVAIHQLPVTRDTLWVRLLARDTVQTKAVQELLALPKHSRYRLETVRHLMVLQVNLAMRHNKTKDIREVIMNLMPVYEKWEAEKIAEGEHRGRKLGLTEGEQLKGIAIARRMLTRGIPIAEIAELTELTILQIQSIQVEDPQK